MSDIASSSGDFGSSASQPAAGNELREYPFSFHGNGTEYFRIWIVNVALTIVTLGFYLPWARVRTRKYFYGNTLLNDRTFDYLAKPTALLKGYIIVVAALILYQVLGTINPIAALPVALLYMAVFPWLLFKSVRFKCHNSAYANVRLRFTGSCSEAYTIYLGLALLAPLTLGLIIPYQAYRVKQWLFGNLAIGQTESQTDIRPGQFYKYYLVPIGLFVVVIFMGSLLFAMAMPVLNGVMERAREAAEEAEAAQLERVEQEGGDEAEQPENGSGLSPEDEERLNDLFGEDFGGFGGEGGEGELPPGMEAGFIAGMVVSYVLFLVFYLFIQQYLFVRTTNYTMTQTTLGSCRLHSEMRVRDMVWIVFSNVVLCILTLGLYIPWALVRLRKYRIEKMKVFAYGDLQDFIATKEQEQSALGDAAGDYLDFEIGF